MSFFDSLKERGIIAQMTNEEKIKELMDNGQVTFYVGFDPTADSLHVGHFVPIMAMAHMQRAGHRPIALFGGGTALVGDPSGKTDMRKMLTRETLDYNISRFKEQMSKLIDFSDGKALMANNKDWLCELNYIEFIREIGVHFSVNRMLAAECYKQRLERGLSFFELNYMIMQSYDFLELNRRYGCVMQLGGDDQWSNIIGGVELCRRCDQKEAYGMTFSLLQTSEGKKMGKTEKGALWLDPEKTSPFDFYQYWRNIDDADVINCMKMLTFMPMDDIRRYEKYEGSQMNEAKEVLAYEVTKIIHGDAEAQKAQDGARALFGKGVDTDNMPTTELSADALEGGSIAILDLMLAGNLIKSKGEGRRLVDQGGVSVDDEKVTSPMAQIEAGQFEKGYVVVKKGKKIFHKFILA